MSDMGLAPAEGSTRALAGRTELCYRSVVVPVFVREGHG